MSYTVLKTYEQMTAEQRIAEFRKWMEDALDNHRATVRSLAGTMVEQDPDIENVIATPFNELALLINDYKEDSPEHFLIKYRLENNVGDCEESILDTNEYGELSCSLIIEGDTDDEEELAAERTSIDELIDLCRIFCFEDLQKSFEAWRP